MEFNFEFAAVENAYKPSGRISFIAIPLMLLFGGAISVLGGYLLGMSLPGLDNFSRNAGVVGLIIEILLKLGLSLALGYAIAFGVYGGGRIGKNRNIWVGIVIGFICGLAAFIVVWSVGSHNPKYGVSTVGPFMAVAMFCAIVFIPVRDAAGGGAADPFCEVHNQFMKMKEVSKLPISSEREAMMLLGNRQFEKVGQLSSTDDMDDYSTVHVYYCNECKNGYISMTTTLTEYEQRSDGSERSESKSCLVFSSALNQSEVEMLVPREK